MWERFERFDMWLLTSVVERLCHWLERVFGKDNFFFARLLLTLAALSIPIGGLIVPAKSWRQWSFFWDVSLAAALLIYWHLKIAWIKKRTLLAHDKGLRNPEKPVGWYRLSITALSFLAVILHSHYGVLAASLFVSAMVYFVACDPLRSGKSKVRKFFESIVRNVQSFVEDLGESIVPKRKLVPVRVRIPRK